MGERRILPNAPSDYYKEAKSISDTLKIEGQKKWAKLIIENIEAGSTSTEILMGLRWVFQECLKTRDSKLGDMESRMLGLISKIDGALK